jgi:hypothetical protein
MLPNTVSKTRTKKKLIKKVKHIKINWKYQIDDMLETESNSSLKTIQLHKLNQTLHIDIACIYFPSQIKKTKSQKLYT